MVLVVLLNSISLCFIEFLDFYCLPLGPRFCFVSNCIVLNIKLGSFSILYCIIVLNQNY